MAEQFRFTCLDPRKTKRARITETLSPLGPIRWMPTPRLSWRDWPETKERAEQALVASRTVPAPGLKRSIWSQILRMQYNGMRRYFTDHADEVAVAWNGLNGSRRVFMDAAKDAGAKTLFFELGPFPGRITVDPEGVNNANCLPRKAEPYLAWLAGSDCDPTAWRALGTAIKQRAPDAPPVPTEGLPPLSAPFVFVPLQVPGDSQLRLFGGNYKTVESFVAALICAAGHLPNGWHLRLKEHPSTPAFFADMLQGTNAPIYLDNATDTFAQVAASRGIVTVNSSVGLEAMFFDKPVVACGECFWTIPGMADRATNDQALQKAMATAAGWSFDVDVRDAVMSFLNTAYYPKVPPTDGDADAKPIFDRLNRAGAFDFGNMQQKVRA